jgi:hypothetical protein
MTVWELIYERLTANGIEAYSPGQKTGQCLKPYVVIRNAGTIPLGGFSTKITKYEFLCYVPVSVYSTLEPYVKRVSDILKGLAPMLISLETELPDYTDSDIGAQLRVIQYRLARKIEQ